MESPACESRGFFSNNPQIDNIMNFTFNVEILQNYRTKETQTGAQNRPDNESQTPSSL